MNLNVTKQTCLKFQMTRNLKRKVSGTDWQRICKTVLELSCLVIVQPVLVLRYVPAFMNFDDLNEIGLDKP
jgi:hypothetical protein